MNQSPGRYSVGAQGLAPLRHVVLSPKISVGLSCLLLILTLACGGSEASATPEDIQQVRGQIIEVIARNITEIETLRIRDDSGRELAFTSEGFAGFTPSHMKEHQLFGQSVLVFYVEKGGRRIVVDITD